MTMQLSLDELQYLLNAIDTHVRANGLNSAPLGAALAEKIQNAANALSSNEPTGRD